MRAILCFMQSPNNHFSQKIRRYYRGGEANAIKQIRQPKWDGAEGVSAKVNEEQLKT